MSKKNLKTFAVMAKIDLDVSIDIKAENLEDALKQSLNLEELDFVTIKGDFNDGNIKIIGFFEND